MAKALKRFLVSNSLNHWNQNRKQEIQTVLLTREETHHLKNVLRIKEGDTCLLLDRDGNEFISRLKRFLPEGQSEAELIESVSTREENSFQLTVAQAIPQDRKMDEMVRKSAELGIFELIPLLTERTVVRIAKDQVKKVHERWERIAEQTLKQSRLSKAPRIAPLASFDMLCSDLSGFAQTFLLHPSSEAKPIRECTLTRKNQNVRILLMIGPEGGFSPHEVEQAGAQGVQVIKMGSGILKTDTAFVAAASFFQFMCS